MNLEDRIREIAREEFERLFAAREREASKRRWLTVRECAQYLGVSERAVRARIERKTIPVRHNGRSLLVDRIALDREIESP